MALPVFLTFVGCLLGCSIALAVVVKNLAEGVAVAGKKPFVFGSLSAFMASLAAYLSSYMENNLFNVFWFLGGIFLLLGIVHMAFVHNRYFYANTYNSNKVLMAEILFGISVILFTILLFSSLQYFFKDKDFLFYPVVMSALLFFVPLLVVHTFEAAYNIPAAVFPTWQYPLHKPIELPDENGSEKILVIGFEIAKKATDENKTYFRAKAPETMKLGDLFYHFINDYNALYSETTIQYTSSDYEPQEWWFYRKPKWHQLRKIFNPELSVRENGIKENTVIVCERLSTVVTNPKKNTHYARQA